MCGRPPIARRPRGLDFLSRGHLEFVFASSEPDRARAGGAGSLGTQGHADTPILGQEELTLLLVSEATASAGSVGG